MTGEENNQNNNQEKIAEINSGDHDDFFNEILTLPALTKNPDYQAAPPDIKKALEKRLSELNTKQIRAEGQEKRNLLLNNIPTWKDLENSNIYSTVKTDKGKIDLERQWLSLQIRELENQNELENSVFFKSIPDEQKDEIRELVQKYFQKLDEEVETLEAEVEREAREKGDQFLTKLKNFDIETREIEEIEDVIDDIDAEENQTNLTFIQNNAPDLYGEIMAWKEEALEFIKNKQNAEKQSKKVIDAITKALGEKIDDADEARALTVILKKQEVNWQLIANYAPENNKLIERAKTTAENLIFEEKKAELLPPAEETASQFLRRVEEIRDGSFTTDHTLDILMFLDKEMIEEPFTTDNINQAMTLLDQEIEIAKAQSVQKLIEDLQNTEAWQVLEGFQDDLADSDQIDSLFDNLDWANGILEKSNEAQERLRAKKEVKQLIVAFKLKVRETSTHTKVYAINFLNEQNSENLAKLKHLAPFEYRKFIKEVEKIFPRWKFDVRKIWGVTQNRWEKLRTEVDGIETEIEESTDEIISPQAIIKKAEKGEADLKKIKDFLLPVGKLFDTIPDGIKLGIEKIGRDLALNIIIMIQETEEDIMEETGIKITYNIINESSILSLNLNRDGHNHEEDETEELLSDAKNILERFINQLSTAAQAAIDKQREQISLKGLGERNLATERMLEK